MTTLSCLVKMKYFLIKDKVDREEITIEHCPTEQMWTDINRKPKWGAVFRAFRGHVMGIPADYNDASFATRFNFRQPNWVLEPDPTLRLFSHTCLHMTRDDDQTRRHKKHKSPNKHDHHGRGEAARPSSGVDLMSPCRWRGGRPSA